MGQLERYGLYVLVLVIFLILGVAIWGGEPPANDGEGRGSTAMVPETDLSIPATDAGASRSQGFDNLFASLEDPPPAETSIGTPAVPGAETINRENVPIEGMVQPQAEEATRAAPASMSTAGRGYTIKRFDTLSEIAKRELGSGLRWKEILALNPGLNVDNLPIGKTLVMPSADTGSPVANASAGYPGGKHKVVSGDYLGSISEKFYGTSRYAEVIKEANNIRNPRALKPGMILVIPPQPAKN